MKISKDGSRYIIRGGIITFWLAAMFLLARYEAFPEWFTHSLHGYRSVISENVLIQDSWSRIIINGVPAGYSHTGMNLKDEDSSQDMEINNRTLLKISVMGQPVSINVNTTLLLDPNYDLINFVSSVSGKDISLKVTGTHEDGRDYKITTLFGATTTTRLIKIPKDVMLYSPMNSLALRRLRPGQSISIKTMDPISMTPAHIITKAVKRESIAFNGEDVEAILLVSTYQGMQLRSWMDKEGTVLRQETPMGWVIESCTAEEALASMSSDTVPPDLTTGKGGAMLMKMMLFSGSKGSKND
jgi:hypothetical protein